MTGYRMKGFGRVVWVSALLHAGIAVVAALLFNSEPKRVFINPVQMVDLVAEPKPKREKAAPQQPKQAAPEKAPAPVEKPPAPEVKKPPPVPPPKEAKKPEAAPKESTAQSVKIKEKEAPKPPSASSIDDSLHSISESVRKREDKQTVSSKVEEIKKKLEEEEARRERLSKLRAEISSREPAKAPEAKTGAAPAQAEERPSGGSVKAFEDKYPAYYTIIKARIDDNWTYPQSLKEGRVSLIVSIKIARSGELMNASVEVSSGNPVFDESLVSAVWRAAPFPPLPADFEGNFLETGLRFCPGCAQR